eukprot:CAMPEP_0117495422 /NCGR_PEP_ID=MMETSP0784-20121206/20125_1 /TAXON_ID=39447 /ORGANISM="" /LENGTH=390 /DNA_ID=CAMNT_0005290345 /DNA_START=180 /DNA_END=1350 /DNA_ORIENTATION=-
MNYVCWVGRVKSTVSPSLLQEAFGKFGDIVRIETGFAGFAFVEFAEGEAAEEAIRKLNKADIPGVGTIHVSAASVRGYEDACRKRDDYWRGRNGTVPSMEGARPPHREPLRDPRMRSRSRARSRSRSRSMSRSMPKAWRLARTRAEVSSSPSRSRRRRTQHRRSRSRSGTSSSGGGKRKVAATAETSAGAVLAEANCGVNASKAGTRRGDTPDAKQTVALADYAGQNACQADGAGNECEEDYEDEAWDTFADETMPELSREDRIEALCFFDGAGAYDLLLEAAFVLRAAAPDCLNGFPHAFPGLAQEDAAALLNVIAGFVANSGQSIKKAAQRGGPQERSVEVRQSIIMNVHGQRVLRKAVLVDGAVCYQDLKLVVRDAVVMAASMCASR